MSFTAAAIVDAYQQHRDELHGTFGAPIRDVVQASGQVGQDLLQVPSEALGSVCERVCEYICSPQAIYHQVTDKRCCVWRSCWTITLRHFHASVGLQNAKLKNSRRCRKTSLSRGRITLSNVMAHWYELSETM